MVVRAIVCRCLALFLVSLCALLALSVALTDPVTRGHVVQHPAIAPLLAQLGYGPLESIQLARPTVIEVEEVANTTARHRHAATRPPKQHTKPKVPVDNCPSPFVGPPMPSPPPSKLDRKACIDVSARGHLHAMKICPLPAPTTCNSFALLISRKDAKHCAEMDHATAAADISSVGGEGEWVKKTLGPDAFELTINGSQRIVSVWPTSYNAKACEWRYDVRLNNGGEWFLRVAHYFDRYHAYSELWEDKVGTFKGKPWEHKGRIPAWPKLLDNELTVEGGVTSRDLPQPFSCPSTCTSYGFADHPRPRLLPATPQASSLPFCSTTEPIPHAYFPDPSPFKHDVHRDTAPFRPHPLGCRLAEQDVALLDTETTDRARRECLGLQPRRIVIQGDSHGRMLYDSLIPRLLGKGEKPAYAKSRLKRSKVGRTTFEFIWDPFMNATVHDERTDAGGDRPSTADLLILTGGAHQAYEHHSTNSFFSTMTALSHTLRKRLTLNRPTLFISTPAYPPRNGQYVWDSRDWRTNIRLTHWSKESVAYARKAGAQVSDGFASTLPFVRDAPDHAHFRDTPAMEWWMMETLHKLALCDHGTESTLASA